MTRLQNTLTLYNLSYEIQGKKYHSDFYKIKVKIFFKLISELWLDPVAYPVCNIKCTLINNIICSIFNSML